MAARCAACSIDALTGGSSLIFMYCDHVIPAAAAAQRSRSSASPSK